jgi:hypothetical protein
MRPCFVLLFIFALGLAGRAVAQDPVQDRCAEAYEQTQRAKNAGRLREAQQKAVLCGQDACSPILRGDCVTWARELAASIPSVVFDVRHADGSLPRALEASIDGQPVAREELGHAMALDPGQHVFAFRDGAARVEVALTVVEGAQRQGVRARFPAPSRLPVAHGTSRRQRTARALTGIGGAALIGFASLAGAGYKHERDLEDTCAPRCVRDRAEPIEHMYLAADVSLGVGVVAAALGLWSWLGDPGRGDRTDVPLALSAAKGRATLAWSARF